MRNAATQTITDMESKPDNQTTAQSSSASPTCSALIRRCDICGTINAVDLDATPERWKDLQLPDHTVLHVTESEAVKLWNEHGAKCDHKKIIADLRAKLSSQNVADEATASDKLS